MRRLQQHENSHTTWQHTTWQHTTWHNDELQLGLTGKDAVRCNNTTWATAGQRRRQMQLRPMQPTPSNSWLKCLFTLQRGNTKHLKVADITWLMWNSEYCHLLFVYSCKHLLKRVRKKSSSCIFHWKHLNEVFVFLKMRLMDDKRDSNNCKSTAGFE